MARGSGYDSAHTCRTAGIWSMAVVALVALLASACTNGASDSSPATTGPRGATQQSGKYRATIQRTTDGVAHITADDIAGIAFGQGYASGEDRTCSLAEQVVRVNSQRAKWFGPGDKDANLTSDFGWLALGIRERAEHDFPLQSDEVRQVITGFVAGWNAHLTETGVDNLHEWCAGSAAHPWVAPITDVDLYTYARSVMLLASGARLINYIADAKPPSTGDAQPTATARPAEMGHGAGAETESVASNGWAIGSERADNGKGMLLANPHFPWEGELRFWEVGLEIPGKMRVYGAQLTGLPGVGIGFNDFVGWTHTVSAGNRFTAYTLDLVAGDPTSYRYDGEVRHMTSATANVEVRQPDGSTKSTSRTLWRSHYGPILNFPGVGWTDQRTVTYRDANIDNTTFFDQYLGMDQARSLDEFEKVHEKFTGIPLFNTIATSPEGKAWYADTSATPNLSAEAIAAYDKAVTGDPLVSAASKQGAVLLDGSKSLYEWVDVPGARSPGLVPFSKMPQTTRTDYVFNANDSFWMVNAQHVLTGDYSPLHGRQGTPSSPRTHQNEVVLQDTSPQGLSGPDGRFSMDELKAAAFHNEGWTARALRADVASRCQGAAPVTVDALTDGDTVLLPAATVDVAEACRLLGSWNGFYDLDSVGAIVWRELMAQFPQADLTDAGPLFAKPFDPADPMNTPSGLAAPAPGQSDPVLVGLARAVQALGKANLALDSKLGDVQFAQRGNTRVGLHGGDNRDGTTNIVTWSAPTSPTDELLPDNGTVILPRKSALTTKGYMVDFGSSFVMALQYTDTGPVAFSVLTYGNTGDRNSPQFVEPTQRFAHKDFKPVLFTAEQIRSDTNLTEKTVTG